MEGLGWDPCVFLKVRKKSGTFSLYQTHGGIWGEIFNPGQFVLDRI